LVKENVYELRTTKSGYDNEEEEDSEERRGEERGFLRRREGSEWGRVVVSLLFCRLSLSISRISHQFRGPSLFTDFPTTNYPALLLPLSLALRTTTSTSSKPRKSTHSLHSIHAPPLDIQYPKCRPTNHPRSPNLPVSVALT
jgi:hypothetical protein